MRIVRVVLVVALCLAWSAHGRARGNCASTCLDVCQSEGLDLINACACQWGDQAECGCMCSDAAPTHCDDWPGCETDYD